MLAGNWVVRFRDLERVSPSQIWTAPDESTRQKDQVILEHNYDTYRKPPPAPCGIDTPDPRTVSRDKQENEAEQHRRLAGVFERRETFREMADEIRDCHLAAGDERCKAGEEIDGNQDAEN